jgi:hypothetical protein
VTLSGIWKNTASTYCMAEQNPERVVRLDEGFAGG